MVKRILKVLLCILVSLVVLYGIVWLSYGRIVYPAFYKVSQKSVAIPGLSSGFIPQGVSRVDGTGITLVCGYYGSKTASSIFVIEGKTSKEIRLKEEDGSVYTGHAGGLTAVGEYVYVSNASKLYVLPLSTLLAAGDGDSVSFADHLTVPCRASYCSAAGGMLYVGEFHEVGYSTEESHRLTTRDGKTYQAMTFGYQLDEKGKVSSIPSIVYATPDKVQGFAKAGDKVILSCSYGRWFSSHLYLYDGTGSDSVFVLDGVEIPLLILDSKRASSTLKMPHMSEDVEYRDGVLSVSFEAKAKKYGAGLLPASVGNIMEIRVDNL